jgi:hypothetical protein
MAVDLLAAEVRSQAELVVVLPQVFMAAAAVEPVDLAAVPMVHLLRVTHGVTAEQQTQAPGVAETAVLTAQLNLVMAVLGVA